MTWKQAASTRAKREMESQALSPEGKGRLREVAKAIKRKPAGIRRKAETKKGPHFGITSFMATMAVPQKKKGETNTAHSHTTPSATESSPCRATVSSELEEAEGDTKQSTSWPVPTQSNSTSSLTSSFSSNWVFVPPVVHFTTFFAAASKTVNLFHFLTSLLLSYRDWSLALIPEQRDDDVEGVESEKVLRQRRTWQRQEYLLEKAEAEAVGEARADEGHRHDLIFRWLYLSRRATRPGG